MARSGMGVERGGAALSRGDLVKPIKDIDFVEVEPLESKSAPRSSFSRAEKTARSIERNYGRSGLLRLIEGLLAQESGESIGEALGVSRQRVHQWKMSLVREVTFVEISPDLREFLDTRA